MRAEIISVGTELLLGDVINSDAAIVSKALSQIGISVLYHTTLGDNPQRLTQALETALSRSDLIVTTGGLGPTEDDLTKETIAQVAGKPLVEDAESIQRIASYFQGRECSSNQKKQAMLPEGCHVLKNDVGTAPGCLFTAENGCQIAMLPGPPKELTTMLQTYLIPLLRGDDHTVILSHNVRVFGMGEGDVAERLGDLVQGENPTVATYASDGEVYVRVTAKGENHMAAEHLCTPVVEEVALRLGDCVYTSQYQSLEETVYRLLLAQNKTISTAESCTGGLLAKRMTDLPGASAVIEMGVVSYANRIKTKLLGVPEEMLQKHGAVSREVACAMAQGAWRESGASIGIGITGVAGPDGGTKEKPVGLVYVALCDGKKTWVRATQTTGNLVRSREFYRTRAASTALDMARRYLTGLPVIPKK